MWPADDQLQIVSAINVLENEQADINSLLQREFRDINTVTHVYFMGTSTILRTPIPREYSNLTSTAYKASLDPRQEVHDAVTMLSNSITAIDTLSPKLEFVVLQLGTKVALLNRLVLILPLTIIL